MKLPNLLTDRKARDELREKFEVVMAVVVLTGFAYKKYKSHKDPHIDITSFGQENS